MTQKEKEKAIETIYYNSIQLALNNVYEIIEVISKNHSKETVDYIINSVIKKILH